MTFAAYVDLMSGEEEVPNDEHVTEIKSRDELIQELSNRSKRLEAERDLLRHELETEREMHRLQMENLALSVETELARSGQSATPLLDKVTDLLDKATEYERAAQARNHRETQEY
jgi:hypothetical protein